MRRLIIVLGALVVLLASAAPVAGAPPIKQSGTFESASAMASDCEQQGAWTTCTDVFVDLFGGSDFTDTCVSVFTYRFRGNGPVDVVDEVFGCGPADADVADDLSSATLSQTTVPTGQCGPSGCTQTGSITVSASWTAIGSPVSFSSKSTFTEGNCTFRQTSSGERVEANAILTVDGTTYDAVFATIAREEFVVSERCR